MSTFTPDPGTLFYAESLLVFEGGRDRSFHDCVFRGVALDQRIVVADIVAGGSYSESRRMLLRQEFAFSPVGPHVAAALGLAADVTTAET